MCIKEEYKQLAVELEMICEEYRGYVIEVEKKEAAVEYSRKLKQISQRILGQLEIGMPELLLALMDVYEVTRDEEMLQEVLDVVSSNMKQLSVSVESVKLLAYCYYYVEEEECLEKAKEILAQLRKEGRGIEEIELAERIFKEFI